MGCDDRGRDYEAEAREHRVWEQVQEAERKVDKLALVRMKVGDLHKLIRVWLPSEFHTVGKQELKVLTDILQDYK